MQNCDAEPAVMPTEPTECNADVERGILLAPVGGTEHLLAYKLAKCWLTQPGLAGLCQTRHVMSGLARQDMSCLARQDMSCLARQGMSSLA